MTTENTHTFATLAAPNASRAIRRGGQEVTAILGNGDGDGEKNAIIAYTWRIIPG